MNLRAEQESPEPAGGPSREPYVSPVIIDYGDIVMIPRSALGGRRDGAPGDDGSDDLAGTS